MSHKCVDIDSEQAYPDNVCETHIGFGQHRLDIVDAEGKLRRHVSWVPGVTFLVHGRLPGAEEHLLRVFQ